MIFIFHVHFGSFRIILGLRFGSFSLLFCPERRVSFAERERCGGGTSIADGRGPGPATTGALDEDALFWWGIYWIDVLYTHTYIYIYILRLDKIINFYDWDNNGVGIRPLTGQQCSEKCDFTFLHCDHGWNGVMATTTACSFRV